MKNTIRNIMKSVISVIMWLGLKFNQNFIEEFLNASCVAGGRKIKHFLSYKLRPTSADQIYDLQISCHEHEKTAVVMQGPIMTENNFTIETLKIYKKTMPDAIIIVSTWNDTNDKIIKEIEQLGAYVVLSGYPLKSGIGNINFQVFSTNAGLKKAKELGVKYVLKTRTDQRLERMFLLEYFFALLSSFPIGTAYSYLGQGERIIFAQGTKTKSSMFIPFFLSDFFMFGETDDIMKYFDFELQDIQMSKDEKEKYSNKLMKKCTRAEYSRKIAPEVMLARNYVTLKNTVSVENTVENSWSFIKSNLILVSFDEVQFYWPKYYGLQMENQLNTTYLPNDSEGQKLIYGWTFSNWIALYSGQIYYTSDCEDFGKEYFE